MTDINITTLHWPDNVDEPVWLFMRNSDAREFAATISDPTSITSEPVIGPEQAQHLIRSRVEG